MRSAFASLSADSGHFNVSASTFIGSNTDSYSLGGAEHRRADGELSYRFESDTEALRTWTTTWQGEQKMWTMFSERRLEPGRESYHERVELINHGHGVDQGHRPPATVQRYMLRDRSRPARPMVPLDAEHRRVRREPQVEQPTEPAWEVEQGAAMSRQLASAPVGEWISRLRWRTRESLLLAVLVGLFACCWAAMRH